MSKEFKITKEKILAMASGCSEAKAALKKGFPEAFEDEWREITVHMEWIVKEATRGYFLIGYYNGDEVVQLEIGETLCLRYNAGATEENYKIEEADGHFHIFKRG